MVNIALIWFHPPAISTTLVVITAVVNFFIWIITAAQAIPIHKQLDHAMPAELIDRLVAIHLYLRLIPGLIVITITAVMMYQAFGPALSQFLPHS